MENNVLITGGSGYLGGTLLNRLVGAQLPQHKLFALVRKKSQAEAVQQYGATPLEFDAQDETSLREAILNHKINIVFYLIDAIGCDAQLYFIRALAELKKTTGQETSGAKMFSNWAGAPVDRPLPDNDPNLFEIHKSQRTPLPLFQKAANTNLRVVEESEKLDVRSYIFFPCIVYGRGEGFGNPISIQTVAVVKAAKSTGYVYKMDNENYSWPVCHVIDTATLYIKLLSHMLTPTQPPLPSGRQGFYLASSGLAPWERIYSLVALHMSRRGLLKDSSVPLADDAATTKMAAALGCAKDEVGFQLAGSCTFEAKRGHEIGWEPIYPVTHIYEFLDEEVALILQHLD